jgi:hypothetical protein
MPRTAERGRLNALKRYRPANDPEVVQAAVALKAGRAEDYIRAVVDTMPPLSESQRARLAVLLLAGRTPEGAVTG